MPSVIEIARRAGVSKSTVSLVLNAKPHVSEAMRRRILDVVEDLKNTGRRTGRGLPPARLLLLHPDRMDSWQVFRELLQGIHAGIEETRSRLTMAVHQPPLREDHAVHLLLHDPGLRPDGVIVMGATMEDPILQDVRDEGLPCVLVARESAPHGFSSVGMDNGAGTRAAVEHLSGLGHRRLTFLGGDAAYEYTVRRLESFRMAVSDLERAGRESVGTVYLGSGSDAAAAFLAAGDPATAIMFVNDTHALAAQPLLEAGGWSIGRERAAVSFDDTIEAAQQIPLLSSISVPRFEIGRTSVRVLVEQLRHPEIESTAILMRMRLRVRDV